MHYYKLKACLKRYVFTNLVPRVSHRPAQAREGR